MVEWLAVSACASGWGIGLLILAGLYASSTVGVTGGPNHGEHPFTVNAVHLIVLLVNARHWPNPKFYAYLGILGAAILLSILVLRYFWGWSRPQVWAARIGMAALYLAMLGIVLLWKA
jgi:hypothetical protein